MLAVGGAWGKREGSTGPLRNTLPPGSGYRARAMKGEGTERKRGEREGVAGMQGRERNGQRRRLALVFALARRAVMEKNKKGGKVKGRRQKAMHGAANLMSEVQKWPFGSVSREGCSGAAVTAGKIVRIVHVRIQTTNRKPVFLWGFCSSSASALRSSPMSLSRPCSRPCLVPACSTLRRTGGGGRLVDGKRPFHPSLPWPDVLPLARHGLGTCFQCFDASSFSLD